MKMIAALNTEEYEEMMETLGLLEKASGTDDTTRYFNAWHFGQNEEAGDFVFSASL